MDFKTIFPIGSIYMSTSSTNPGTWMVGTTWARFANGRVLVGVDDKDSDFAVNKTGGSKTHKLTIDEMPKHRHAPGKSGSFVLNVGHIDAGSGTAYYRPDDTSQYTDYQGGGVAHSILQPYIAVYIWRRTA